MLKYNRHTVDTGKRMWIGGRNTGNEKASDEEELKCSLKRKRREKKSMFHIERGTDWKRGNAQLYVILRLLQFLYPLFVHSRLIPAFKEQNVGNGNRI